LSFLSLIHLVFGDRTTKNNPNKQHFVITKHPSHRNLSSLLSAKIVHFISSNEQSSHLISQKYFIAQLQLLQCDSKQSVLLNCYQFFLRTSTTKKQIF